MTPHVGEAELRVHRRTVLGLGMGAGWLWLSGCSNPLIRGQSPDIDELELEEVEQRVRLIKDYANSYGLFGIKIEGIGLVTGLDGTGSNPTDDHRRRALIDEMQSHNVSAPHQLVASSGTSLVLVQTVLPPAVKKGDRLDVQIRLPSNSQTTSLRGGWLMSCRLREMEVLGGKIHTGHIAGLSEGYVLVEASFKDGNPKVLENRGRILGTAVSHMERSLGLTIIEEFESVETSSIIGAAINTRFQVSDQGRKSGIANPKRANFVELSVPKVYKNNVERFMTVVRHIALKETPAERAARIRVLETKLLEPTTASPAAIQLEAIGREGVATLRKGLESNDMEVRFNSAEALAYQGIADGAETLGAAAKSEVAFRWGALAALVVLDELADTKASDVLTELLHVSSAETRYGAFRALRTRNPHDPCVRGEVLGEDRFSFHVVATSGEPLVHFALSQRPEVVLFGSQVRLTPPPFLFVNKQIMLKRIDANRVKISRFQPGKPDQQFECSCELAQLIPTLVKAGAGYEEVLQAIRTAKKDGYLDARVALDAVPRPKRTYYREDDEEGQETSDSDSNRDARRTIETYDDPSAAFGRESSQVAPVDFNEEDHQSRGFWSRWFGKMWPDHSESR